MRTGEMPPTVCLEARHLLLQLPASTWTLDGTSSWRTSSSCIDQFA